MQGMMARGKVIGGMLAILLGVSPAWAASARGLATEGTRLYERGKYQQAAEKYRTALEKEPESDRIHFNLGAALYKQGRYREAVEHFQKALLSEDEDVRRQAMYNLGNALYKAGMAREQKDLDGAIKDLESSDGYFGRLPEDQDARYNQEVVRRQLERLRRKKKQQQQQKQTSARSKEDGQKGNQKQQARQKGARAKSSSGKERQASLANEQQKKEAASSGKKQAQQKEASSAAMKKDDRKKESQPMGSAQDRQDTSGDRAARTAREDRKKEGSGKKIQAASNGSRQPSKEGEAGQEDASVIYGDQLDRNEALRLLERYEQTQQPKKLLNVFKQGSWQPVLKDW